MKTQQAIVSDSGWEAQVCNPYEQFLPDTNFGVSKFNPHWVAFNENNPPRPLNQYHTPGAKVTVREVWQYRSKDFMPWQLFPVENMDNYKGYEDFQSYNSSLLTQICFEVVSEEESNHISDVGKKVSVEEATEKFELLETTKFEQLKKRFDNGDYDLTDVIIRTYNYGVNHILQSGEYVKVSDVEKVVHEFVGNIGITNQILTTLKNKQ